MLATHCTLIRTIAPTAVLVLAGSLIPLSSAQAKPYLDCSARPQGSGYLGVCAASSTGNFYRMYVRCRSSTGRLEVRSSPLTAQGVPVVVQCGGGAPTSRYFRVYTV